MGAWGDSPVDLLRRQLSHAFAAARWQVADLTDDEYFWEPSAGCWSVRRRDDARSREPCGTGEFVIDGEWPLNGAPVELLGDSDLAEPRPVHWGESFPIGLLVWQIAVEHLHHSAEIGALRDFRRGHGRQDAWPEPLLSMEEPSNRRR